MSFKPEIKEQWEALKQDFGTHYGPMLARNEKECKELWVSGLRLGIELEHRRVLDLLKSLNPTMYYAVLDELDKRK